ncbi:MAG: hypothetical protein EPN93_05610, partial [Spirochaetes bacterium]
MRIYRHIFLSLVLASAVLPAAGFASTVECKASWERTADETVWTDAVRSGLMTSGADTSSLRYNAWCGAESLQRAVSMRTSLGDELKALTTGDGFAAGAVELFEVLTARGIVPLTHEESSLIARAKTLPHAPFLPKAAMSADAPVNTLSALAEGVVAMRTMTGGGHGIRARAPGAEGYRTQRKDSVTMDFSLRTGKHSLYRMVLYQYEDSPADAPTFSFPPRFVSSLPENR